MGTYCTKHTWYSNMDMATTAPINDSGNRKSGNIKCLRIRITYINRLVYVYTQLHKYIYTYDSIYSDSLTPAIRKEIHPDLMQYFHCCPSGDKCELGPIIILCIKHL